MQKHIPLYKLLVFPILVLIFVCAGIGAVPQYTHAQTAEVVDCPNCETLLSEDDVVDTATKVADQGNLFENTITAAKSILSSLSLNALVVKGYTLDPLAWAVAKSVLNSVVQSTVRWINSGFQGSPAFVTNISNTLLVTSNSVANGFLGQLATNGSISSPFQNAVAAAVGNAYNTSTNGGFFSSNPYTLNQTTSNDAAFFNGNFIQGGGLNTWAAAFSNTANNPFGAAALAQSALGNGVTTAQTNQKNELNWGNGFQSYKGNCNSPTTSNGSTNLSNTNTCSNATILTPGSVIGNSLYKSLGSGVDQLVTANQLGEVVNALMGQLVNQVLGSGGLSGTTQPAAASGSTGSSASYIDQIGSSSSVSAGLASTFAGTISTQISALQSFQTEWQTLNNAATAAEGALSQSACYPDAADAITNTVQPVLAQAALELSDAQTSLAALQNIQSESNAATASGSTDGVTQASTDYSTYLAASTTPSGVDIQNAITQSTDTGTTTPASTYTTLVQLTQAAQTCSVTPSTQYTEPSTPVIRPGQIQN